MIPLISLLQNSVDCSRILKQLLQTDREGVKQCIQGEILTEYQNYLSAVLAAVEQMEHTLIGFLDKQKTGLL